MDKSDVLKTIGWPLLLTGGIGSIVIKNDNLGRALATIGIAGTVLVAWGFLRELPQVVIESQGGVTYEVD